MLVYNGHLYFLQTICHKSRGQYKAISPFDLIF
jgi:hypothetical protein